MNIKNMEQPETTISLSIAGEKITLVGLKILGKPKQQV
jgi:hypothetical protein